MIYNDDYLRYRLLKDTLLFTRYFFKKQYNRKFVVGEHHRLIAEKLQKVLSGEITRLIINMPPRYGKTELAVKNFIAQGFALNPKAQFIHTSGSDSLALDNSEYIRDLIKSDAYQRLFPFKIKHDSDSKKKWYTETGGGIYATSAGGQVTGFGAGLVDEEENEIEKLMTQLAFMQEFGGAIVVDDAIKPEDAHSKIKRDSVNRRFETTIRTRTNSRKTPIVIVMHRLHEDDLTGYLLKVEPGEWDILSLSAIKEDGTALWPFKQTVDELYHIQKVNNFVFSTQYQQTTENIRSGGEFYKNFDINIHVKKIIYDPETTIGVCVDNNVYPYIAISIWQIKDYREEGGKCFVKQIHEISAEDPNNTTGKAAQLFVDYLKDLDYENVVQVYADQTTEARNTIDDDKKSFLDKFCEVIRKEYIIHKRIQSKNPPVALSGEFVDSILGAEYDNIVIEIDESCQESIKDYNTTKADAEGKILKKRITNSQTGISYEENGHYSDLIRYKLFVDFKESFRNFAKGDLIGNNYVIGKQLTNRRF